MELVKTKEIEVTFIKTKAHSDDSCNNMVDKKAKNARKGNCIQWHPLKSAMLPTIPKWLQTPIEIPIRHFLKHMNQKREIVR